MAREGQGRGNGGAMEGRAMNWRGRSEGVEMQGKAD